MTKRAIVLGFLGAIAICGLTYLNDQILMQTFLVGNHLPVSVFGTLIIVVVLNMALFRINQKMVLTGAEFTVILGMTLAACSIPGSGLMRTFPSSLILPHYNAKLNPSWQSNRLIDELMPEHMMVQIETPAFSGAIRSASGQELSVAWESPPGENPVQMKIRVNDTVGVQVRVITEVDPETGVIKLDAPWDRIPAVGQTATVLRNHEDEILTTYVRGSAVDRLPQFQRTLDGESEDMGERHVVLAEGSSVVSGMYVGAVIKISGGPGHDAKRLITAYDGETRTAVLDRPWNRRALPDAQSTYILLPAKTHRGRLFFRRQVISGLTEGATDQTLILDVFSGSAQDLFCDQTIEIMDGPGRGQQRLVVDFDGNSRIATLDRPWDIQPQAGARYRIEIDPRGGVKPRQPIFGEIIAATLEELELGGAASHRDNLYNGMTLEITSGPAAGLQRQISTYQGRTRSAIMDRPLGDPLPASGDTYKISPRSLVPWHAWIPTLRFWLPVIIVGWIGIIGLSLVVHRQWSEHEHLPYPVAAFTNSLLPDNDGLASSIFRNRGFWIAAAFVFAIYLNNFLVSWYPGAWEIIPTGIRLAPVIQTFAFLTRARGVLNNITIFTTVVGIAYFLSKDVSLSVGLSPILYAVGLHYLGEHGISLEGGSNFGVNHTKFLLFGSYLGVACMILYTGRNYYWAVTKRALFLKSGEHIPVCGVWGARMAMFSLATIVLLLSLPVRMGGVGLDWQLSLIYGLAFFMTFTVVARVIAETGMFFIQTSWVPSSIIVGIMGARALGPETTLIIFFLCTMLMVDPRESLMPFMVNSLKLVELRRAGIGTASAWFGSALLVGLVVAVVVTINLQYREGAPMHRGWSTRSVPSFAFIETLSQKQVLTARGTLEESRNVKGFSRFAQAQPSNPYFLLSLSIGFGLVVIFSFARLRFAGWPFHPVMFLLMANYSARKFAPSFLLGWFIKVLVTRFGGAKVYQKLKPIACGLIAGELLGAFLPIIIGFIYRYFTGNNPVFFRVYPG